MADEVTKKDSIFDVIVVGGGPGGSSAAYFHAQAGKSVALFEFAEWPRDKICGDGVTGKSLNTLHEMNLGPVVKSIKQVSCDSCLLSSPNGTELTIPIYSPEDPMTAFCIEREVFDDQVFNHAVASISEKGKLFQRKVVEVIQSDGKIVGVKDATGEKHYAELVVGAGGYNCPVSRFILSESGLPQQDKSLYSAAVREYWAGLDVPNGGLQIHFLKGIQPGYFWIFPVGEGKFNIGVGMLLKDMDKQKVKLKSMLDWVVSESPMANVFENAQPIAGTRKGWMLPLSGKSIRKAHYPGAVLVGDAASLVDPFTGEGIGNALVSAKLSVNYLGEEYQKALEDSIGKELSNSYRLQNMLYRPWLVNWFFKKASKKPDLQMILTDMLHNKSEQSKFKSKRFWIKSLLF